MPEKQKYSEGRIVTPPGRVSFPHLAAKNTGGEYPSHKFEITLLFPKDETDLTELKNLLMEPVKEKWPDQKNLKGLNHPIRDGNDKDLEKYPEYEDCYYIRAKSGKRKPVCVGPDKAQIDAEEVYAGCWARISVSSGTYVMRGEKGVTLFLGNVQFVRDDVALGGGGAPANEEFDELESGGSGDGDDDDDIDF